jgi:threonyl-tRNA synthetase
MSSPESSVASSVLQSLTSDPQAWLNTLTWTPVDKVAYQALSPLEQLVRIRHSSAHLMAAALQDLDPKAEFAIGPATPQGFFYDIKPSSPLKESDLEGIESRMKKLAGQAHPFEVAEVSKAEALALFKAKGQSHKLEILERIPSEVVTLYRSGPFVDLCAGPHVPHTGLLQSTKLMGLAGAHWRGETIPTMTRVSGTAWANEKDLKRYLEFLEASKARDHRTLGPQLDLFSFHPWGMSAFWHPKGVKLRRTLESYWRTLLEKYGYVEISNPILYRKELFETSGHWQHFKQNMFIFEETCCDPVTTEESKASEDGKLELALKPMNCPDTMLFFRSRTRSYKELPLRVAEAQLLHRNEATGAMHGLMRTRMFSQDDAHIFVLPHQVQSEMESLFRMLEEVYSLFQLDYSFSLSTRPENYMGALSFWEQAEDALKKALDGTGKPYLIEEGEGAFYGPKIDVQIRDSLGRQWQCATFQLDLQLPERFELKVVTAEGTMQQPLVIHRAIFGSFERFMGILIEHLAGAFPTWLSPVQAIVFPIAERHEGYGQQVLEHLQKAGVRAIVEGDDSINYRVRAAETQKIPYMLIVGDQEAEAGTVSIRRYSSKERRVVPVAELVSEILAKNVERPLDVPLQEFGDLFRNPSPSLSTESADY